MSSTTSSPPPKDLFARLQALYERIQTSFLDYVTDTQNQATLAGMACVGALVFSMLLFSWLGTILHENVDPVQIATDWQASNPFFGLVPRPIMVFFAQFFNGRSIRYMLPPLAAFVYVFVGAVRYLQDIYNLERFSLASRFIVSCLFGGYYSAVLVDGGQKKLAPAEVNLLDIIGGPGYVLINPGSAVLVEGLFEPLYVLRTGGHLLSRFESIGLITSLEDQYTTLEEMKTITKDGIQVAVRNIRLRYRILSRGERGEVVARTAAQPYPFDESALMDVAYNLSVDAKGQTSWANTVRGMVVGDIQDFINMNNLDYLTAPRDAQQDAIREMRERLLSEMIQSRLRGIGAELLWVDVGHIEIVEPDVDQSRINLWQSKWVGDASVVAAYSEAKQLAYREMGRAEGQAELIMSITDALEQSDVNEDSARTLQELFLVRTAQILDALREDGGAQS